MIIYELNKEKIYTVVGITNDGWDTEITIILTTPYKDIAIKKADDSAKFYTRIEVHDEKLHIS